MSEIDALREAKKVLTFERDSALEREARLRREKAVLVEALDTSSTMMEALATQLHSWGHDPIVNWRGQLTKNAALRSANEKGEPT